MGTYKVFNGTDWVNICDCQVHIRNASNNWQLLDPRNCVTKYWTGTEWCEVTCCTCAEGYTLNNQTNTCEKVERIPATASGGTFYPITVGNRNVGYGSLGATIYQNITGAVFPLNGFGFPDYVVKDNAGTGTTYNSIPSMPNNLIFDSQNIYDTRGRLNYSSMWGTGYPNNTLFTVRFCITITEAKTYIFALAGDNQVNASITSTTFQGGVTDLNLINLWGSNSPTGSPEVPTNTRPFNYWHMFPIDLPVGTHTFKLSGYNFSGDAAFGAEVYNISISDMLTLMGSTTATPADLEPYILFTTKNLIQSPPLLLPAPGQTGITYTCPSGYTFTDCYGVPQCTINTSYPCGGTPPGPDPCACPSGQVVIGTQTWTCRNLDVEIYRNGDPIPQVQDPAQWATLTTGAWCYHDNNSANGPIYGKLYNWYAVNDSRGLAPAGWKIPTESEWYTLRTYLGGESELNAKAKEVGTQHWLSPNSDATNEVCFTALGGSQRGYTGDFDIIKKQGYFWTSTEYPSDSSKAWYRVLNYDPNGIYGLGYVSKRSGMSIRLIKDI